MEKIDLSSSYTAVSYVVSYLFTHVKALSSQIDQLLYICFLEFVCMCVRV